MDTTLSGLFDFKNLTRFTMISLALTLGLYRCQQLLVSLGMDYMAILIIIAGILGLAMAVLYSNRLIRAFKYVNQVTKSEGY